MLYFVSLMPSLKSVYFLYLINWIVYSWQQCVLAVFIELIHVSAGWLIFKKLAPPPPPGGPPPPPPPSLPLERLMGHPIGPLHWPLRNIYDNWQGKMRIQFKFEIVFGGIQVILISGSPCKTRILWETHFFLGLPDNGRNCKTYVWQLYGKPSAFTASRIFYELSYNRQTGRAFAIDWSLSNKIYWQEAYIRAYPGNFQQITKS